MRQTTEQDTRLFRLVVLAILILIFITVATIKIWELRISAERVGVLHTVGSLQSAVGIKLSEQIIREGLTALAALHQSNPMRLWSPPPGNYLGEFKASEAPAAQGIWYFDLDEKVLVYQVLFTDHFTTDNVHYPAQARYQLQFDYRDNNNNQRYDPAFDEAVGLSLKPLNRYSWTIEEP